jgi:hypothetical protein
MNTRQNRQGREQRQVIMPLAVTTGVDISSGSAAMFPSVLGQQHFEQVSNKQYSSQPPCQAMLDIPDSLDLGTPE